MLARDDRGRMCIDGRPLADIIAAAGARTPLYLYDLGAMAAEATALTRGFCLRPHLIAYAVKANSAGPVVRALAAAGCGAEVGSLGELSVALHCGIEAQAVMMNGVAKTDHELDAAIGAGEFGLFAIVIDCVEEIGRVEARAKAANRVARISLRINPNVRADTIEHIATGHDESKFGIAIERLPAAIEALSKCSYIILVGLSIHIGSQLTRTDEYLDAADALFDVVKRYEADTGDRLELLDVGGGYGIDYGNGCPARPADFAHKVVHRAHDAGLGDRLFVVEPGRSLVGPHGVLVATVVATKRSAGRRWLIIDAGMNDLLRPALYRARHRIEPLDALPQEEGDVPMWKVVGPVCESTDDFGSYAFGDPPPDKVVVRDAGAYGFTMASHYNGRGMPAEVFVHAEGKVTVSTFGASDEWAAGRVLAGEE